MRQISIAILPMVLFYNVLALLVHSGHTNLCMKQDLILKKIFKKENKKES